MPTRTDSHIIEYHEDGTWTETSVVNGRPATKKEKATGILLLGSLLLSPFVPIALFAVAEKIEERRDRKAAAKKAEQAD